MHAKLHAPAGVMVTLLLSGCQSTGLTTSHPSSPPDCGAVALQDQLGKRVTGTTADDARVGGKLVQSLGAVRIFVSGQAVTHDFREGRLNLETDPAGNLVRASCG